MHLFVDAQPSFLFIWGQQIHDLRKIGDYVLSDFLNESTSFFGDFHKNFAAIVRSVRTLNVAKIFQTIYQARRCGGRVVHLFRDFAHGQKVMSGNVTEKKELGKGDLPSRKFLRQPEHQTALKRHHDVRKPFNVWTDLRSL
jgi:hypothetical protein